MLRAGMAAGAAARDRANLHDAVGLEPARVLVADDDAATRGLIASTLRASGYEVDTASDGQEAIARFARGGLDLVLLDAVMPRVNGVDACRTIKGLRADAFVSVALMFAKTDARSRVEALKIGADAYVCKPFEETELLRCVSSAVRTKRAHDRLRAARESLERLRGYDEVTGARSFLYLHERLSVEFARAEKHAEPLACCILDVDQLKVQNERGGRSFGDVVLSGVADVIRKSIRDTDVVARYGGDEFFVMLPATHFAGSLVVASRIWRDISQKNFSVDGRAVSGKAAESNEIGEAVSEIKVTASLGVALFPSRDVRTKDALLTGIEAALFEAKRRGGNRLCVFQQEGFIYTPSASDVT